MTRQVLRSRDGRSQNALDHLAVTPIVEQNLAKSNMADPNESESRRLSSVRRRNNRNLADKSGRNNNDDNGKQSKIIEKIYKKYNEENQDRGQDARI